MCNYSFKGCILLLIVFIVVVIYCFCIVDCAVMLNCFFSIAGFRKMFQLMIITNAAIETIINSKTLLFYLYVPSNNCNRFLLNH